MNPYREPADVEPTEEDEGYLEEEAALWDAVVVSIVGANDCKDPAVAIQWADAILSARRERFA